MEQLGVTAKEESAAFVADGAIALLGAISKQTNYSTNAEDTDFVDGIMLMVFCGQFSRFLESSFEIEAGLALLIYYGHDRPDSVAQTINSYNRMTVANNKSIEAIGNLCVQWCWKPDEESVHELAELRRVLLIHANK